MDNRDSKLSHFEDLSPRERREVAKRLAGQERYEKELKQAEDVASLIDAAQLFDERPVPDEVLSYLAVMREIEQEPQSARMQQIFREIEVLLEDDSELSRRYSEIRANIEHLDISSNASRQFESLAGYTVDQAGKIQASPEPASDGGRTSSPSGVREPAENKSARQDRPPRHGSMRRVARLGLGLAAIVLGVVVALVMLSRALTPDYQQLAYFDADELRVEGFGEATRGGEPGVEDEHAIYLSALQDLRAARSSTLGLFPRYNLERVRSAEAQFAQVISAADEGGFLYTEAAFWLAQSHLLQNERQQAARALQRVIEHNGRMADTATEQLARLEQ